MGGSAARGSIAGGSVARGSVARGSSKRRRKRKTAMAATFGKSLASATSSSTSSSDEEEVDDSESSSDSGSSSGSSSSSSSLDFVEFARNFNELNDNINFNNYMGELKTPGGFRYSVTDLAEKVKEYEVEDNYEIPDRKIDPAKLAPPLDHDLYTQNEMKKKFGKRFMHLDECLHMIADNWEALQFSEDKVTMAYRAFDSDQAGYLTYNQVRAACLVMGEPIEEEDFEDMFNIGDMEHSGQFYYEDVVIMGSGLWMKDVGEDDMNDF